MSKINEKTPHQQIVNFLNVNQLLSERQHGYRHGKSTATAMQDLLNIINRRIDKNERIVVLFLDLSKAFDCVSHENKLKNVKDTGFWGKASSALAVAHYHSGMPIKVSVRRVKSLRKTERHQGPGRAKT